MSPFRKIILAPFLEVKEISKAFGRVQALRQISFAVQAARITVIAGPDGSGKSTLLKTLLGLEAPDSGEICLQGQPLGRNYEKLRSLAAYMSEQFSLYADLTVEENLNFFAVIQMVPRSRSEELKQRLFERTGLGPFRRRLAGALSGGMKQKLSLAAALISSPELLLLDEPTTGIDPPSRLEFFSILKELKAEGRTIILTTPYLDEAEKGDDVIFLRQGQVILSGPIAELRKSFPWRVYRLLPAGSVFDAFEELKKVAGEERVTIRGRYLRVFVPETEKPAWLTKFLETSQEEPRLEDVYFYCERGRQ